MAATVQTAAFTGKVSGKWRKLLKLLPNFDVFRDAAGYYFDEDAANHVVQFFETRLHHVEGDLCGQLLILQDWQKAILGAIFGWKSNADGLRRFRKILLYIPRKNGKTTLLAGIGLYMLTCEDEGGQQIFGAAAGDSQARLSLNMAKKMLEMDEDLAEMCKPYQGSIESGGSSYKIVTSGFRAKHGLNVNCGLIDEVHEHPSRELSDVLTTSSVARSQPLFMFATTSDEEGESFCNELYDYFVACRDGVFCVASVLPIIYELPIKADWRKESNWKIPNPNLGVSLKIAELRERCAEAQRIPSYANTFCRLHMNQRRQSLQRWLALEDWDMCHGMEPGETPEDWRARMLELLAGERCWGGLDLGSTDDLTAFVLLFEADVLGEPDSIILIPWFWCPENSIRDKEEANRDIYQGWLDRGFLRVTEGSATDFRTVREDIMAALEPFDLVDIGMDMHYGAETCQYLQAHYGDEKIWSFDQGFKCMTNPCQDLEIRMKNKTLYHGNSPILRWCAGNVMLKTVGNLKRPLKEKEHSTKKIDGISVSLMAIGRYTVNRPSKHTTAEVTWI